jgi:hypothetical protein
LSGKRHHYVPQFLLRRFAIGDSAKASSLIYRLDLGRGAARKANVVNEAVRGHYYRIHHEDGTPDSSVDELFDRLESAAAEAIASIASGTAAPSRTQLRDLAQFVVTQKVRTPQGREHLAEGDELVNELILEAQLSNRDEYYEQFGEGRGKAEVEAERLDLLDRLKRGKIGLESPQEREIAMMFLSFEHGTRVLLTELGWTLLRAPDDADFVLSDHPVAHFDPNAAGTDMGVSFLTTPESGTLIPLDPSFALWLSPQEPATWREVRVNRQEVDDMNLLTYAWADRAIYGRSQAVVTRVRMLARRNGRKLAAFRKRPPRIWVTETYRGEPLAGERLFKAKTKNDGLLLQRFQVDPRADQEKTGWRR